MEPVDYSPSRQGAAENVRPEPGIGDQAREYKPLYDKFQAASTPRTDRFFGEIWEWAKARAELKDRDSVMWEVTKLANRLGSPGYGEKPWSRLVNYVSTYNRMTQAERQLKEMEAK